MEDLPEVVSFALIDALDKGVDPVLCVDDGRILSDGDILDESGEACFDDIKVLGRKNVRIEADERGEDLDLDLLNKDLAVEGHVVDTSASVVEFDELDTGVLDDVGLAEGEREKFFSGDLCVLERDFVVLLKDSAAALTIRASVLNHTIHASIRGIEAQSPASTWWCF